MDFKNIAIFAALGGIVATWSQVKGILQKILSIFVRTDQVQNDWIGRYAFEKILNESKIIRWGNSIWVTNYNEYLKKYKIYAQFYYRRENVLFVLFKGFIPIILKRNDEGGGFQVTYFYKSFEFKSFLEAAWAEIVKEATQDALNSKKTYFYLTEISGEDSRFGATTSIGENVAPPSNTKSSGNSQNKEFFRFDWLKKHAQYIDVSYEDIGLETGISKENYYWSKEALKLKGEIQFWHENAPWFQERGIVHRRSCILHGEAGGGKSRMVLQIAQYLGIPLRKINISNMSDKEFENAYSTGGEKCTIILLEDIDVTFRQRTNVLAEKSKTKNLLSFDTLINTISGVKQNNGVFLAITTNLIESCDPALIRSGRCDVKIEVGPIDKDGREFIAKNILRDWPELIDKVVEEGEGMTVADFENKCVELGRDKKYEEKAKL